MHALSTRCSGHALSSSTFLPRNVLSSGTVKKGRFILGVVRALPYTRCEQVKPFYHQALTEDTLKQLSQHLGSDTPDSKLERVAVGRVVDAIKEACSQLSSSGQLPWTVDRVVQSGSYGRATGIAGRLCFPSPPFPPPTLPPVTSQGGDLRMHAS